MLEALLLTIHMRVTKDELVATLIAYVSYIKHSVLAANLGIEDYMEEHISELLANLLVVVLDQSVTKLETLLYRIWAQRLVGLLGVPRTFLTQSVHHIKQASKSLQLFFSCAHFVEYN